MLCDSLYVEEPSSCKVFEPTLPQARLQLHIFCSYEQNIRPSNQDKNTTVNLLLLPKLMEFVSLKFKIIHSFVCLNAFPRN